jgi:hypothetical protein
MPACPLPMFRFVSFSVLLISAGACGGSTPAASGVSEPDAEAAPLSAPSRSVLPPVQAGSYELRLSANCASQERTATGVLTLRRIAGDEGPTGIESDEAVLLWGQTDLDFEPLKPCFGGSIAAAQEPIHPSVLVEVLEWDGEPQHPVLLVSAEGRRGGGARRVGIGIAMWVERVDHGHIGGIWSRWELIGRGEGRWEADLVTPR